MRSALGIAVLAVTMALLGAAPASAQKVLVFSKTAGFRHDSIPQGIAAVQAIGQANGFAVDATEDAEPLHGREPRAVQGRRVAVDHG